WDGTKAADNDYVSHETSTLRTRMWINGTECTVKRIGHPNASPTTCRIGDPLYVGGNRSWCNFPIALDAFDIFSGILTDAQVGECNAADSAASGPALTLAPAYETKTTLNQATGWQTPPADVTITTAGTNKAVKVCIGNVITGDQRKLYFTQAIPLDRRVTSVNLWADLAYDTLADCGFTLAPIYTTGTGTEVIGSFPVEFVKSHIAMPNSRASGLWQFCMADPLFKSGVTQLVGVSITMTYTASGRTPAQSTSLYLRDLGLERIKYASSTVYYVVGNYRDNFSGVGRPLTEQSGGTATPYVLLDNLVDQAKSGRPATLNLYVSVFDTNDSLIYSTECTNVPAATATDAAYQVSIPITKPGTYRIRCQSYNASTGVYFTTDWSKYIVINGATQTLTPLSSFGLLAINPTKPFGRLETADPRTIGFTVNNLAMKTLTFPLTIKYKVIPYDEWIPGTAAKRTLTLDQTLTVNGLGTLTATYTPLHPVELVVAELWQGTTVLDHQERPIGIRNELSVAPAYTAQSQVKSLDDLAGTGKNWRNISFHSNPGDNIYQQLANNIAEAIKLTTVLGMNMRFNRIQPIPGVYDWDYLTPMFDLAQTNGCTLLPYLNLKWPADWAPVEFQIDANGCMHRGDHVWGYMGLGNYLYMNGATAPGYNQQFVQQLARKYLNHLGLAGFYFENEHIDTQWSSPISLSYHEAYRQAFGTWLQGQYGTIAALNTKYGTSYAAFTDVQLPVLDGASFQQKVMFADFRLFQRNQVEQYVTQRQQDTARAEDPKRPIVDYTIGEESDAYLQHIASNGAMLANGGIHSTQDMDANYERYNAVPGLRFRMEPHDMWNYMPVNNGLDEMLYGMLGMGGRGLQTHVFLPGTQTFNYNNAMHPTNPTPPYPGLDKLTAADPLLAELRDAEKLHDTVGILNLYPAGEYFRWSDDIDHRALTTALYVCNHYSPVVVNQQGQLAQLNGRQVIFLSGDILDTAQRDYLVSFVQNGGKLVLDYSTGQYGLSDPDSTTPHYLLNALGVDFFSAGSAVAGINASTYPHDAYTVGSGKVLVFRRLAFGGADWEAVIPSIMTWAGVTTRLANSTGTDNKYMQIRVLQKGNDYYLATTFHRYDFYTGPASLTTNHLCFTKSLPAGTYSVTELTTGTSYGAFTPAQLATGFDVGKTYQDLQWYVFKISLVPVVGWKVTPPAGALLGDTIAYQTTTFPGVGTDATLTTMQFVPSTVSQYYASLCRPTWANGKNGTLSAVSLAPANSDPMGDAAIQCGTGNGAFASGNALTLHFRFMLTHANAFGGGAPPFELDGDLVTMVTPNSNNPDIRVYVSGRGSGGAALRLPHLRISGYIDGLYYYFSDYYPDMGANELQYNTWYDLVFTWDGTQAADNNWIPGAVTDTLKTRMWINGTSYTVKRVGHPNASPATFTTTGPVLVGGDRQYNDV
ncbi:MAG TPA: beta-galactosidase, partial [Armatimonadota bacterium]